MPLHKYRCECGHEEERVVSWKNVKNEGKVRFLCPNCEIPMKHVIQGTTYMHIEGKSSVLQKSLSHPNRSR